MRRDVMLPLDTCLISNGNMPHVMLPFDLAGCCRLEKGPCGRRSARKSDALCVTAGSFTNTASSRCIDTGSSRAIRVLDSAC